MWRVMEAYSEPYQTSMMKLFAKTVNGFSDIWKGTGCATERNASGAYFTSDGNMLWEQTLN